MVKHARTQTGRKTGGTSRATKRRVDRATNLDAGKSNALSTPLPQSGSDPVLPGPAMAFPIWSGAQGGSWPGNHPIEVRASGDSYEQEADRVAEQIATRPAVASSESAGRRSTQRDSPRTGQSGGGTALSPIDRAFFESNLGYDFCRVRLHFDGRTERHAAALDARAFTIGANIGFGPGGQARPGRVDRRLLAHELTHVVQQGAVPRLPGIASTSVSGRVQPAIQCDRATRVGPISGQGGLISDASRRRFAVIVGATDTPRTVARRLLPLWTGATPFTAPGASAPVPNVSITEEQLAKALLVYHRYFLPVPAMTKWRVGLRLPLPVRQDPRSAAGVLHPSLIERWAELFEPEWTALLDQRPAAAEVLAGDELGEAARAFLSAESSALARGLGLSTRAVTNAVEAAPFVSEVLSQLGGGAFDVALQFMDSLVNHQVGLLAGQNEGRQILDAIRAALARAPANLSNEQQSSLARANRMLGGTGAFDEATARAFARLYATEVPGCHCMTAVYWGLQGLFGQELSSSVQDQVTRDSRAVRRRTGRDTNHMDRIMRTVRERGLAGPETLIRYRSASDSWEPDPQATVLGMTRNTAGWYFFGFSIHGAYHSVILAVDKTDLAAPRLYWMDQFSTGFTNEVTNALPAEMRRFHPSYGFAVTRLWQIFPPSGLLIPLR